MRRCTGGRSLTHTRLEQCGIHARLCTNSQRKNSHEHLDNCGLDHIKNTIDLLNEIRRYYIETKNEFDWLQIIQLLPSSYNQKATVQLNYEVLANMYHARKNHKLYEWRIFCNWIETLSYAEVITGRDKENDNG